MFSLFSLNIDMFSLFSLNIDMFSLFSLNINQILDFSSSCSLNSDIVIENKNRIYKVDINIKFDDYENIDNATHCNSLKYSHLLFVVPFTLFSL